MKQNEIKVGEVYVAKVNNNLTEVRLDSINERPGYGSMKAGTTYGCTNLRTGRKCQFRSAAKFRARVNKPEPKKAAPWIEKSPTGYYSCCKRTVGDSHSDDCPMFQMAQTGGQHTPAPTDTDYVPMPEGEKRPDPTPAAVKWAQDNKSSWVPEIAPEEAPIRVSHVPPAVITGATLTATTSSGLAGAIARNVATAPKLPPHVIVTARAGTGKTTTLIEGLKKLFRVGGSYIVPSPQQDAVWKALCLSNHPRYSCFAAFNNSIAAELQNRIPKVSGCAAKTLHGLGYYAVRKAFKITRDPNAGRTAEIVSEFLHKDLREVRKEYPILLKAITMLASKCKMNLIGGNAELDPGDLWREKLDTMAYHYDIELPPIEDQRRQVYDLVPQVLERCKDVARDGYIDFDDMVWLPVVLKLPVLRNDLMLIDEAQDMNRCQQALAMMAGDRLILCGDPAQAIYGFAGADSVSMDRMFETLNATPRGCIKLPLTVTRRCGKAIVAEAKQLVPDFEAFPTNAEGKITEARYPLQKHGKEWRELPYEQTYLPMVQDGDMILCRANAPLVNQCFRFLKRGRKATIQGRDVADSLIAMLDKFEATSMLDLIAKLGDWLKNETTREQAQRMPSESKLQQIEDRYECLMAFTLDAKDVWEVKAKITAIFTDNADEPGIKLSSIHRAKGLEAHRVFYILGFGRPQDKMKAWEIQAETNLRYVAITRAKDELIYVS